MLSGVLECCISVLSLVLNSVLRGVYLFLCGVFYEQSLLCLLKFSTSGPPDSTELEPFGSGAKTVARAGAGADSGAGAGPGVVLEYSTSAVFAAVVFVIPYFNAF